MQRWERRLKDLAHILESCHAQYFNPELFRINTNQFLQTARTVTFLIQKDKAEIPDFENWYGKSVLTPWVSDEVMAWAKESRNIIEKQGDLELYSSVQSTLIYSYIEEQDISLESYCPAMLGANVTQLVRIAQKRLPTGVADSAYVRMERRWVANSLPNHELLSAMAYIYGRSHQVCQELSLHIGCTLEESIPSPSKFHNLGADSRRVGLYYLNGMQVNVYKAQDVVLTKDDVPSPGVREAMKEVLAGGRPACFEACINQYGDLAVITFNEHGNHIPMLFMLDSEFRPIAHITTNFRNTSDKFAFWRSMGELAAIRQPEYLVFTAEAWQRKMAGYPEVAIRNLEIEGEILQVCGMDRAGNFISLEWEIIRDEGVDNPRLAPLDPEERMFQASLPNFFIPAARALGLKGDILRGS